MMGKKKAARGPAVGTKVRIRDGVTAPEFPDVSCAGWTGTLGDVIGSKERPQFVIEWDAATVSAMPPQYVHECEQKQLLYTMACFPPESVELLDGDR
jgi:hypothetical protein